MLNISFLLFFPLKYSGKRGPPIPVERGPPKLAYYS